jgi:tRNA A-37 threonylcarbamoyl transferase component Bud32
MKVFIKGKGHHVELGSNEYISQGGQGKVYAKGNLVYKIYHDASNVIPEAKMQELSVLSDPSVIKPEDILCNSKNKVVGYTMRFVADTHPLCKLFTKSFKQRENISSDQILKLVQRMQDTVQHIHSNDILVVDLNEMNFLVSSKFDEAYFIDVDSYQTKSFPATVLMESVRDRHAKGFTELTDWFPCK